ncbi:hypothetical protein GCM10023083_84070 [Streptomyces phyllanthi]
MVAESVPLTAIHTRDGATASTRIRMTSIPNGAPTHRVTSTAPRVMLQTVTECTQR